LVAYIAYFLCSMLNSVVFYGIFVDSTVTNREAQSNGRLATLPKVELRKFNFPILCGNVYFAVFAEVCEACKIGRLLRSSRPTERFSMAFPFAACHEKRHDRKFSLAHQMFHACHAMHSSFLRGSRKCFT